MRITSSNIRILTLDELEKVFMKSFENAQDLYSDACLLLENERIARAQFLFRISNEELGKCVLTLIMIDDVHNGRENWKQYWNNCRDHKTKAKLVETLTDYLATNSIRAPFWELVDSVIPTLERSKMSSLYADFLYVESNTYFSPKEIISKKDTEIAKFLAERAIHEIGKINIHEVVIGNPA